MFVSFTVENAFSFYDAQTLSARAVKTCKERLDDATFKMFSRKDDRLVKVLAIYGANASGKSNLFCALNDMRRTVLTSAAESQVGDRMSVMPFMFTNEIGERPTTYVLEFIINDYQYKYGYSSDGKYVIGEYLLRKDFRGRKYKELFSRALVDGENRIVCGKDFADAEKIVSPRTRRNALFLSTCAMLAIPEAEKIVQYFATGLKVVSAMHMTSRYTAQMLEQGLYRNEIVGFLKMTDPGIGDIGIDQKSRESGRVLPDGSKEMVADYEPVVTPVCRDGSLMSSRIPLMAIASLGTEKAFNLSAYIFEALANGSVLALDELDSRLHPLLTKEIIRLFNDRETNPRNAQLIFNTHDTNLLGVRVYNAETDRKVYLLRRDEIYFVEKNGEMCSRIYSLIDFKKDGVSVRNDASYEKDYLEGLYGAIPYIGKR